LVGEVLTIKPSGAGDPILSHAAVVAPIRTFNPRQVRTVNEIIYCFDWPLTVLLYAAAYSIGAFASSMLPRRLNWSKQTISRFDRWTLGDGGDCAPTMALIEINLLPRWRED
jgi:hypothetical protein